VAAGVSQPRGGFFRHGFIHEHEQFLPPGSDDDQQGIQL
jgi:hypothetical protein